MSHRKHGPTGTSGNLVDGVSAGKRSRLSFLSLTPQRSRIMRSIKGRGNASTEKRFLAILRANGIKGWRRHWPVAGTPDFAFPRERLALFVDGCFWHCCPTCYKAPRNNEAYWANKAIANGRRDRRVDRELRVRGWSVIRIWEHSLKCPARVLSRIERALRDHRD